jgi:hypothetical protein
MLMLLISEGWNGITCEEHRFGAGILLAAAVSLFQVP